MRCAGEPLFVVLARACSFGVYYPRSLGVESEIDISSSYCLGQSLIKPGQPSRAPSVSVGRGHLGIGSISVFLMCSDVFLVAQGLDPQRSPVSSCHVSLVENPILLPFVQGRTMFTGIMGV